MTSIASAQGRCRQADQQRQGDILQQIRVGEEDQLYREAERASLRLQIFLMLALVPQRFATCRRPIKDRGWQNGQLSCKTPGTLRFHGSFMPEKDAEFPTAEVRDEDIRPNESAIALEPPSDAAVRFIGEIRTPWTDRKDCPRQGRHDGPECRIVLDPLWQYALKGLEEYETIEVLYWLDRSRRDLILQSPRGDGNTIGTFALRSPVRPNPIGTAIVRLMRIDGATLVVRGLDCLDGTPLIDIKPDRCAFTPKAPPKPVDDQTT